MAGHTRTRTGCWTCREDGYKCDEQKPQCARCIRLNKECKGYGVKLKWKVATSTPARQKRQTKRSKSVNATSTESPASARSPISVISSPSTSVVSGNTNPFGVFRLNISPSRNLTIHPDLSTTDQRLLHYWNEQLSSLISVAPRGTGPSSFQSHLATMTSTGGALQSVVLSMAATHLGLASGDTTLRFEAYKHQRDAIQQLQSLIVDPFQADTDHALATVLMMQVSARLFSGEEDAYAANHLHGAKAMILRRKDHTVYSPSSSEQFLLSLFAYHDILSSVSRGSSPLVDHDTDFLAIEATSSMESVAQVLRVVARISEYHEIAKAERLLSKESDLRGVNFYLGLGLQQTLINLDFGSDAEEIRLTAEAFRHAAYIYLYRVWLDMGSPNPTTLKHVQECIDFIVKVPVESPLTSSHTWPLFTAGCEAVDPAQRQFVRDRFLAMYEWRKFPSLKRILRDIEEVWAVKDAEQIMGGLKVDCIQVILRQRGREVDLA